MAALGQQETNRAPFLSVRTWGTADEIRAKTDFGAQMSVAGGGAVVPAAWPELRLIAMSRHSVELRAGKIATRITL